MSGLLWTTGIWASAAAGAFQLRHRMPGVGRYLTRANAALILALLGTFSIAGQSDTEAVLEDPVVLERVLRGGLSALALALAAPLLISRIRERGGAGHKGLAAIVCYTLVALVSTVYSAAPIVTAGKVFELSAGIVPVAAVAYGPYPRQALRRMLNLLILAMGSLVAVGVVGFFILPDTFGPFETRPGFLSLRTLSPPYAHSNAMASMGAIVGIYSLARSLQGSAHLWLWRIMAIVSFVALVLASGRQGVVMYLVGLLVVMVVMRRRTLFIALVPSLIAFVMAYSDVILDALSRDRPQNLVTLTGRIGFWEAAIDTWLQHPWTGWGYGSGGRFVALASIGRSGTSSLHSGYFEALTGVGILGMIPLLYAIGRIIAWSWRQLRDRADIAAAALVPLLMLRTAVSLGFGGWLTMELLLFLILVAWADADFMRPRQQTDIVNRRPPPLVAVSGPPVSARSR